MKCRFSFCCAVLVLCAVAVVVITRASGRKAGGAVGSNSPAGSLVTHALVSPPHAAVVGDDAPVHPRAADSALVSEALRLAGVAPSLSRSCDIAAFVAGLANASDCATLATNIALVGHELASAALQRWVELDPQGAIRSLALAAQSRIERSAQLTWMLRDYSARNPAEALAFVQSLGNLGQAERAAATAAVLPAYASQVDAAKALDLLRQLPSSIGADAAGEIFANLAKGASPEAIKTAFATATSLSGSARSAAMSSVVGAAVAQNPQLAVDLWNAVQDAGLKGDLTAQLARKFGDTFDPADVVNWLGTYAPERGADAARIEAFAALAAKDLPRAEAFLQGRPVGQQDDLREGAASALDPIAAMKLASSISDEPRRSRAIGEAATRLADSDPQALMMEVGATTDNAAIQAMLPAAVDALAYESSASAVEYVQRLPADQRDSAAKRLVERLADVNPGRAATVAAATISDAEVRVGAVGSALSRIVDESAEFVLPDLGQLGVTERDKALAYAAAKSSVRNPPGAMAAASLIQDEANRSIAVQQATLGAARSLTSQQALLLLDRANVPEEVKATIRQQIASSGN